MLETPKASILQRNMLKYKRESFKKLEDVTMGNQQKVGFLSKIPGIAIYPDGTLVSFRRKEPRILKPYFRPNDYVVLVDECKGRKRKTHYVHRLVAECFIPNPFNLPQVNHKDFDKHNNSVGNLEWCTQSHNIKHSELKSKNYTIEKPRGRKLTPERSKEVSDYIKKNFELSNVNLAKILNVSRTTVYNKKKKLNLNDHSERKYTQASGNVKSLNG